jgi:hypothetical protein
VRRKAGFSTPSNATLGLSAGLLSTQKIRQEVLEGSGQFFQRTDDHDPIAAKVCQSLEIPGGSSVAAGAVAFGMELPLPNFTPHDFVSPEISNSDSEFFEVSNVANVCDLGLPKISNEGNMDIAMVNTTNEQGVGIHGSMGIASSSQPNGGSATSLTPSCSLSLIEDDTETHHISTEEVIAFGGIPKPSLGVRTSDRLDAKLEWICPRWRRLC